MSYFKYKKGQRVRIDSRLTIENSELGEGMFEVWFSPDMVALCIQNNYILTINKRFHREEWDTPTYEMVGLKAWGFTESMILKIEDNQKAVSSLCKSCKNHPCELSLKEKTCAWIDKLIKKAEEIL
jgi:hypothetical protein